MHKSQWPSSRVKTNKTTPWHVIVKLLKPKDKDKILKAAREKKALYTEEQ